MHINSVITFRKDCDIIQRSSTFLETRCTHITTNMILHIEAITDGALKGCVLSTCKLFRHTKGLLKVGLTHVDTMSPSLCSVLFLFLLHNREALVKAVTPKPTPSPSCPDNNCCPDIQQRLLDMMNVITAMNSKLNKQATDLEVIKTNLNKVQVSTDVTSTKLSLHIQDLLLHDDRLRTHDISSSSEDKLVKSKEIAYIHIQPLLLCPLSSVAVMQHGKRCNIDSRETLRIW